MNPSRTFVIAEAGVNHNGSLDLAAKLIDAAVAAGADAVKFQTFKAGKLTSTVAQKARYQTANTGTNESQLEMIKKLELGATEFEHLAKLCAEKGIEFLSTPFDEDSVELVVSLGVRLIKYPSGELTNPLLLRACARTRLPIILSTGMATLGEIEAALGVLAAEWLATPETRMTGSQAFRSNEGQGALRSLVSLLHCTTEYPAPFDEVNLKSIDTLRAAFGLPVGYSDHTEGVAIPIAAVALGAMVIEKHFTLDRSLPGPDHRASLEPGEMAAMIAGIRAVEMARGDGIKRPSASEIANITVARRSLVAAQAIEAGAEFTRANLTAKRPGNGVSAMRYDEWLGKRATRAYLEDELIEE